MEHLFGLHFVKTGKVDVKYAKLLARLQKYRERSDYGLVTFFTQEDLEQELAEVDNNASKSYTGSTTHTPHNGRIGPG